ncbi:hypothetical protein [Herbidospora daliensis]|uniref:hypothetical protein n=1 Tax=Herbidospora daliensis TaxID=295585 RepID=UPI0007817618|nr:hypothetical protein [Herbidospora daliensis]
MRLIRLAWAIWALIIADLGLGFMGGKGFAVALTTLAITAAAALASWHYERVERARVAQAEQAERTASEHLEQLKAALAAHCEQLKSALAGHCEQLRQHVLALDRWFALGAKSEATAKIDAAMLREAAPDDTGPFSAFRRRAY